MLLQSNGRSINIEIIKRSRPESTDFEDGNWLETNIKIDVPGFNGHYGSNLRTDDFERFTQNLEKLKANEIKEVQFTTMEEGLHLIGVLEVSGNIKWEGTAKSQWGGSCLTFNIETDYSSIDDLLNQLRETLDTYPVIGTS